MYPFRRPDRSRMWCSHALWNQTVIRLVRHLSCYVYNSMKWALRCIINIFFESHRACCCECGREVASVGRKDVRDPPHIHLTFLFSQFKADFKASLSFIIFPFSPTNILGLCLNSLQSAFHFFTFFLSHLSPSHLSPHVQPLSSFLLKYQKCFPLASHYILTPIPPSPHECTQFSTVAANIYVCECVCTCSGEHKAGLFIVAESERRGAEMICFPVANSITNSINHCSFHGSEMKWGRIGTQELLVFLIHLCQGINTWQSPRHRWWKCNNVKSFFPR